MEDETEDQFEYTSTSDNDVDFLIELPEEYIFGKLMGCLKNAYKAMFELTNSTMTYAELVPDLSGSGGKKNKTDETKININTFCRFHVENFKRYEFNPKHGSYSFIIEVKPFAAMFKKTGKNHSIVIRKQPGDKHIYICDPLNMKDGTHITPLVMQERRLYEHKETTTIPNCVIDNKKLVNDYSKISANTVNTITIKGYPNKLLIETSDVYGAAGSSYSYGENAMGNINLNLQLIDPTLKIVDLSKLLLSVNISTNMLKAIVSLTKLSSDKLSIFYEEYSHIKIVTPVKDLATVYTYIRSIES
jgi:hypothetical protein